MPIKGPVRALFPDLRLKNMSLNSVGYLDAEDIILTKKTLFIDLDSEILTGEEYNDGYTVKITRVGLGLTESDFELDFGGLSPEIFFYMENEAIYAEFSNEKNRFLVFNKVTHTEIVKPTEDEESVRATKERELQEALATDDFEKAARLRDEIALLPASQPVRNSRKTKDKDK